MSQPATQTNSSEEIKLQDIIVKVKELFIYFLRYWILLLLVGLAGGAIGYYNALTSTPTYTASSSFIVEDAKSGGGSALGAYAGIASQFGVDLGGGSSGLYQGTNLIEFLKSRLMIQKVLLTPYPKDLNHSLADIYFELSGMQKEWDKKPHTQNVRFPLQISGFSLMQDSAMSLMCLSLTDERNLKIENLRKSSLLKIAYTSTNEYFAATFVNRLVEEATDFYVQTKTKRSQLQVNSLQRKSDSLFLVLNRRSYTAAMSQDLNPNPSRRIATVGAELSTFNKVIAQTMYTEVFRNLEIAKAALAQDMPNIQIIDKATLPLILQKKSRLITAVTWAFLFEFLIVVLLTVRRFRSPLLNEKSHSN